MVNAKQEGSSEYMWLLHLSTNINTGGWMCRPEEKGFSVWLYDSFEKAKKEMFGLIREWYYETSNDIFDKGNIVPLNKWLDRYCTEDNEDSDALKALPKLIKTYIDNEGLAADEVEDCEINTDKGYLEIDTFDGDINFSGEKYREHVYQLCDVTVEINNFKANEGYLKFYIRDRDTLGEIFEFSVVIMKLEINEFREKFGGPMYTD